MLSLFYSHLLSFVRDRGLLVSSFLLPVLVYVIFATMFAATAGGDIKVSALVWDQQESDESQRLVKAIMASSVLKARVAKQAVASPVEQVRRGQVDVLIQIAEGRQDLKALDGNQAPPILIYTAPGRDLARLVASGALQQAFLDALPDLIVGKVIALIDQDFAPFDEAERFSLDIGLLIIAERAELGQATELGTSNLFEAVRPAQGPSVAVQYYAAAVAILFAMLSALNICQNLVTYRGSGLMGRLVSAGAGLNAQVLAIWGFAAFVAFLQYCLIFSAAWLVFGMTLPAKLIYAIPAGLTSAMLAAAVAGLIACFCQTARQVQLIGSATVLIVSALGGSMIPRFLMPAAFQDLGWATPNAWSIEIFALAFWRQTSWTEFALLLSILFFGSLIIVLLSILAWKIRLKTRY